MPINAQGFYVRQPSTPLSPLQQLIFNAKHSNVVHILHRYTPSLKTLAILAAIASFSGREYPPSVIHIFGWIIPIFRIWLLQSRLRGRDWIEDLSEELGVLGPHAWFVAVFNFLLGLRWSLEVIDRYKLESEVLVTLILGCGGALILFQNSKMRKMEKFGYDELESLMEGEIRLLKIHRYLPFSPLRATIFSTKLTKSTVVYEAISYTWGSSSSSSSSKSHEIILNQKRFSITKATHDSILDCSYWWKERIVWIDFVCINQNDNAEKSVQVGKMREIFEGAKRVVIRLAGPSHNLGFLGYLANFFNWSYSLEAVAFIKELSNLIVLDKFSDIQLANFIHREKGSNKVYRWKAMMRLFGNPWFSRVWIIQEIAVAKDVEILYDGKMLEWRHLCNVMFAFDEVEMAGCVDEAWVRGNIGRFQTVAGIRRARREVKGRWNFEDSLAGRLSGGLRKDIEKERLCLAALLGECRGFRASDERDLVYALLGLASDDGKTSPKPDYENKDIRDVFIETAQYFWGSKDPFAVLSFAGVGYKEVNGFEGLPSWVPNWSAKLGCSPLNRPGNLEEISYRASGDWKAVVRIDSQGKKLIIKGAIIDEILALTPVYGKRNVDGKASDGEEVLHEDEDWNGDIEDICAWYSHALHLASLLDPPKHHAEEFWRTLVGDRGAMVRPAPAALGEEYNRFVREIWSLKQSSKGEAETAASWEEEEEVNSHWGNALGFCIGGRRFGIMREGRMGCVPPFAMEGDLVAILLGAKQPVVLRRKVGGGGDQVYELVGECYIEGIMDGEIMSVVDTGSELVIV